MASRSTIYKWLLGLSGLLVLLLVTILLLAPRLLSSDFIRLKIQGLVTEQTGGRIDYGQVNIVYAPRLTLQINRLEFDLPDVLAVQAGRVQVSPDLSQLASGHIAVDYLLIDEPKTRLTLPRPDSSTTPAAIDNEEVWQLLQPSLQLLAEYAPYVEIDLNGGTFALVRDNVTILNARDLDTALAIDADPEALQIELTSRLPELTLQIDKVQTQIEISKLAATISLQPKKMTLELKKLLLVQPGLDLAGNLALSTTAPKLKLQLNSNIPDLAAVRAFILPLQPQIPGSEIFIERILGGALTDIIVQTEGSTLAELLDLGTLKVGAQLNKGEFFLPRLVHHVSNVSGRINVADRRIELSDAHLESGSSAATIEKAAIYHKNKNVPFTFDTNNARLHFDLSALYNNLSRQPELSEYLEEVSAVSGQLDFNLLNLHGPLDDMAEWKFKANGSIAETVVSTRRFPAPITVQSGSYSANERSISFKAMHIQSMDVDLKFSGSIEGEVPTPSSIEASVSGQIGEKAARWVRETAGLPDAYALDTPITINQAALTWKNSNNVTAKGEFKVTNGPAITGDIAFAPPKNIQVAFSLVDQMSKAAVSFKSYENYAKATFTGHLQQETINNIFIEEQLSSGRLKGDFALELVRDNGIKITSTGKLQGENLLLPIGINEPLTISAIELTGQGQTLAIEHLDLGLGEERVDIHGSITSPDGNHYLDLSLHSGPLDLADMIEKANAIQQELAELETDETPEISPDVKEQPRPFPFSGRVSLDIDALSLEHLSIAPLRADIQFEPRRISAQVDEANLCGVDLLATALITPDEIELKLPINALDQDLLKGSVCLTNDKSIITGRYDLTGAFTAQESMQAFIEAPDELINAVKGEFALNAHDGEIEQSPAVARLLSILNLTEFYRGDYLTLDKSKLGYSNIQVEGQLAQGRLNIPILHFNGTTLEVIGEGHVDLIPPTLDIELLVAPLKTVDTVVKWLPGINYLLAGNLVTIPARVSGPVEDMDIKVIPVGSLGKRTLGLAERIIKIPVKLVEPLVGDEQNEENAAGKEPEAP